MKRIILFLTLIVLTGCKDAKKEPKIVKPDVEEVVAEGNTENAYFTLTMVAKIEKDDDMKLLYTEAEGVPFVADQIKITKVKGSPDFQTVVLRLNDKTIEPIRLRLDLGNDSEQGSITIKSLKLTQGSKMFFIESASLPKFFLPNNFIEFGNNEGEVKLKKDGDQYSPFLISRDALREILYEF